MDLVELCDDPAVVHQLLAIWREVLDASAVDTESDFVELGGTSLTAVRIRGRIRERLGRDVDLLDLLDYPTPAAVLAVVRAAPQWVPDEEQLPA